MPTVNAPSLMSLLVHARKRGRVTAVATGFVVVNGSRHFLVTNRHVVTGRHQETNELLSQVGAPDELEIWFPRSEAKSAGVEWVTRYEDLFQDGHRRWFEHPALGERADVVVLPLDTSPDSELATIPYDLKPGPRLRCGPSDPVSVIGFPFGTTAGGKFAVWATGFVASEPPVDWNELPVFLISCRTREGQSGSPVIAYRTSGFAYFDQGTVEVVNATDPIYSFLGVYSGRVTRIIDGKVDERCDSDLGIVWKESVVLDILRAAAV